MKIIVYIAVLIGALALALVAAGQLGFLAGQMPSDLGVHQGKLKPPSLTPNSVSSQAALYPDNPQRVYADLPPLNYTGDAKAAMARLAGIVSTMPRTTVVTSEPTYLYAQCRTQLLGFTDDVEFYLDEPARVIQVRSASRMGKGDMGVNRKRVAALRAKFEQAGA